MNAEMIGSTVKNVGYQKYMFEEPKWFLIKIIFLVAFLNKDKRDSLGNHPSTSQAHRIFCEGFDFSDSSSINSNFIISSTIILAEVFSRLQSYDNCSIYSLDKFQEQLGNKISAEQAVSKSRSLS